MLNEYDCVRLKGTMDAREVASGRPIVLGDGTLGCVMVVHGSDPPAYEVEFFDSSHRTLAVETVVESQLELDE